MHIAKVKISFDEERTNLLREQIDENKEAVDQMVKMLVHALDGANMGVAITALFLTIMACVRNHFDKPNIPNRFEAMNQIGMDLIQYIHLILLKKF